MRIRNLCGSDETIYTYNTQCRLSQLLMKTTNGVVTKYVYGLGLIGEEKQGCFKTYHFDYRGSTVAITNESGCITDTFKYDTYGKLISRTGSSFIIFGYNGRDGVVTDRNGLIYMRARYYSPELKRFVNADIIKGEITNAITLNRYAYANGNPVSNVDPFGLAVDEKGSNYVNDISKIWKSITDWFAKNFGFATTLESKYDTISVDGIFWGHEEGVTLSKVYSGNYKPIEFIQEISRDISLGLDSQFGIKVNFNDESGFKMSYGKNETSFEVAIGDFYLEMLVGLDKIGFTTSAEADWKEYEIGAYDHWYIRPNTLALAAVAVYFAYPVVVPAASTLIPILEKVGK